MVASNQATVAATAVAAAVAVAVGRISQEEAGASGVTILSTIIPESRGRGLRATSRLRFPLESNDASIARVAGSISLVVLPSYCSPPSVYFGTHVHYPTSPCLILHTSRTPTLLLAAFPPRPPTIQLTFFFLSRPLQDRMID